MVVIGETRPNIFDSVTSHGEVSKTCGCAEVSDLTKCALLKRQIGGPGRTGLTNREPLCILQFSEHTSLYSLNLKKKEKKERKKHMLNIAQASGVGKSSNWLAQSNKKLTMTKFKGGARAKHGPRSHDLQGSTRSFNIFHSIIRDSHL